jgi:WD40 repeat protein
LSRLFLSHSSANNREAVALKQWLGKQNPRLANEIFLDLDPGTGIHIGQRWREALNQAATRCEGVVCLLSTHWESSEWCRWEYSYAAELGKRIFVALLQPGTGAELLEWQQCRLFGDGPKTAIDIGDGEPVLFETEGLYRLREGIRRSGIGSDSFEWPIDDPDRAPYRGWRPFEPVDAGIFCGRDAQIVRAMDALRSVRQAKTKQWFVILGPSGSGKSSFLRAGLIPRMQRDDRQFLVLSIVRPERDVLLGANGLAAAIHSARQDKDLAEPSLEEIGAACANDPAEVHRLLIELRDAARLQFLGAGENESPPTIVLPLDQAEELLSPDGAEPAERFLQLMRDLVTPAEGARVDIIIAATIRSDRFAGLQTHPELADTEAELFGELRPMPTERFEEVITGPAERVTADGRPLEFAPDLVDQLLADCKEGGDTLPLLALALSLLYEKHGASMKLTLAHYVEIGGLRRVVQTVIDGILDEDPPTRRGQLELLRDAFIPWLATVNPDNDQPMRRVARWSDLPEASRPLIDGFVANRLLVKDRRDNEDVVEAALESLLWQWDDLATWLNDTWRELKAVDDLERAAAAWEHNNCHPDWLLSGSRLVDAEALADTAAFHDRLAATLEYLDASRQAELRESTSLRLISSAKEMLARNRSGGDLQACKQLLAAQLLSKQCDEGAFYNAVVQLRHTQRIWETHTDIATLAFSPDGRVLATGGREGTVRFWDISGGQPVGAPLAGHTGAVFGVAFSPDGQRLATASDDTTVRLWDIRSGQPVGAPLTGHTGAVFSVAFSPDGQRLATASDDTTVRLWDTRSGQSVRGPLTGHTDQVWSVAFSPDGQRLASASSDKTVRLWDIRTGQPVGAPLTGHTSWVFSVAFSPDGRYLASAGNDTTVRLWDIRTGQPAGGPLTGHTVVVRSVAFSPDGQLLASAGNDTTVRLWDIRTGQPAGGPLTGHTYGVSSVAFSPDGRYLATEGADGTVRLWNIRAAQPLTGHTDRVFGVAFSPDGHRLAAGGFDKTIRLWNADTGQPIGAPLTGHTYGVRSVTFSPDGHHLASASDDTTVRLWHIRSGQPVGAPFIGHTDQVFGLAFSPDGHHLASASSDKTVRMWDTRSGQPVGAPFIGHTDRVFGVAFSPDGRHLASASWDKTVRVWDAHTGQPITTLSGHTDQVFGVAFSPDGRHLASASSDKTVRLWDIRSGQPVGAPLIGHTRAVLSVAFSPHGQRVASASEDTTVRLWDTRSGQPVGAPLTGHTSVVFSVAFSPDGQHLASGSGDKTVRLWPAVASRQDLCAKLTTNMSRKQWRDWVSPDIPYMKICDELPIPPDDPEKT